MNNQYLEFLLVKDLTLPKAYTSLLKQITHIYGENLSVAAFRKISPEEFAKTPGIKKTAIDRFKKLQRMVDNSKIKLPSLDPNSKKNDQETNDKPKNDADIPLELEKEFEAFFLRSYSGKRKPYQSKNVRKLSYPTNEEENILLQATIPPEKILDAKIIEKAKQYALSFFYLLRDEQKIIFKFNKYGVPYDQMTPLYILTLDIEILKTIAGFGKQGISALQNIQEKILNNLKKQTPSPLLIPKNFGKDLSLNQIQKILQEDIEQFLKMPFSEEFFFVWKHRLGYKTERLILEKIGNQINKTRERVRQLTNTANKYFLQGTRIAPEILQEKITSMNESQILKQCKDLRTVFSNDTHVISFLLIVAKIDPKKWK